MEIFTFCLFSYQAEENSFFPPRSVNDKVEINLCDVIDQLKFVARYKKSVIRSILIVKIESILGVFLT